VLSQPRAILPDGSRDTTLYAFCLASGRDLARLPIGAEVELSSLAAPAQVPDVLEITRLIERAARRWTGDALLDSEALASQIHEILFGARQYWAAYVDGLMTLPELRNVILARVQTFIERRTGMHAPAHGAWIDQQLENALDGALALPP
jgi:hypothetical protein